MQKKLYRPKQDNRGGMWQNTCGIQPTQHFAMPKSAMPPLRKKILLSVAAYAEDIFTWICLSASKLWQSVRFICAWSSSTTNPNFSVHANFHNIKKSSQANSRAAKASHQRHLLWRAHPRGAFLIHRNHSLYYCKATRSFLWIKKAHSCRMCLSFKTM